MSSAVSDQAAIEIATPECEKGLGQVILAPDSKDLIPGVRIKPYPLWPDDRGYFLEVLRVGQGLAAEFPTESTQVSAALSYPGTSRRSTSIATRRTAGCGRRHVPGSTGGSAEAISLIQRAQHAVRWSIAVVAALDAAGSGGRLQSDWSRIRLADLCDGSVLQPRDEGRIPYNDDQIKYDWKTQHK